MKAGGRTPDGCSKGRGIPRGREWAMAELGETSVSSPPPSNLMKAKPVVVRVKRKLSQARLDAFWLEINERPLKRALLDLGSLSISDCSTGKVLKESRTKKLLVQHVETIRHSEAIKDVLHSFLQPGSSGSKEFKRKIEERRSAHKQDKQKQDQLRSAAIQKHEDLARNARFEQIWKSRRGCTDPDEDSLRELCHLYDVVQVDVEDRTSRKVQKPEVSDLEDNAILCNYLPLIREYLPTAAAEIESDMRAYASREDNYVYDLYTVDDGLKNNEADKAIDYPLVQVDVDDEYYDGPLQSEYESDDSNAEDNPRNDYPDEELSRDDEDEDRDPFNDLEGSDSQYEEEIVDVDEESEDDQRYEYHGDQHYTYPENKFDRIRNAKFL
uniref:RNA-directed DNA methylation 4 n=1 Tax=Elaeis guineensis var. tenera TaxID=51953 RepID=A0A6I9R986_ELAGV|nr:RNA-directed DNA methylation 4 [Elaeis guineensis]